MTQIFASVAQGQSGRFISDMSEVRFLSLAQKLVTYQINNLLWQTGSDMSERVLS